MNQVPDPTRKREYVQTGFNRIAVHYNRLNDVMTAGMHRRWKDEAVRMLGCRPGQRILDVCSGTGDLALRAQRAVGTSGQVIAFDFSWQMMQCGRDDLGKNHPEAALHWMCGDAEHLPFADQSFDGALVGFGLRNLVSMETGLREIGRVLKPGARLVNLDTAPAEWTMLQPMYSLYMNQIVPRIGAWITGAGDMYTYLASSAAAFDPPQELQQRFGECGYVNTGFAFRPRVVGGAALVWGERPRDGVEE